MVGYDEYDKKASREAESKILTTIKATLVKAASEGWHDGGERVGCQHGSL